MCHFGTTGPPHFKVMPEAFFLGLLDHFSLRKRGLGMYLVSDDMERRPPTIQKSTLNDKQNKNCSLNILHHIILLSLLLTLSVEFS